MAGGPPTRTLVSAAADDGSLRWHRPLPGRWLGVGRQVVVQLGGELAAWVADRSDPAWTVELAAGEDLVSRAGALVVTRGPDGLTFRDSDTGTVLARTGTEVTWWAGTPDGGVVVADTRRPGSVAAIGPDGAQRWRTPMADRGVGGCCVEVVPGPGGQALVVDRRVADRAAVLDLASGAVLLDASAAAEAVPGQLLIAAVGSLGILQGGGGVTGVSLATGEERWRFHDASIVVALDPLVVASRRSVVAPGPGWQDDPAGGPATAGSRRGMTGQDAIG